MGKVVQLSKKISREELDKVLSELGEKREYIDLDQFIGKIDFGVDGLEYQLKIRDEWN